MLARNALPALPVLPALIVMCLLMSLAGCDKSPKQAPPPAKIVAAPAAAAPSAPMISEAANDCSVCKAGTSPPPCTLCLQRNPLLLADANGNASGVLRLCKVGPAPVTLALQITDFQATPPGQPAYTVQPPTGPQLTAVAPEQADIVRGKAPLVQAPCVDMQVQASGLVQPGVMTAKLTHEGNLVATVKAVRTAFEFRVVADAANPQGLDLKLRRGETLSIPLRNEDAVPYRMRWRLELGGQTLGGSPADIVTAWPQQALRLQVQPRDEWFEFWLDGFFLKPATLQGRLVLRHEPDPGFQSLAMKEITLPVKIQLHYFGDTEQAILNAVAVLALLILGIGASLLINFALPMQRKRVALKQRLADLDGRLGGIGSVVHGRTLNLLRVEKRRLREELRSLSSFTPATEVDLPLLLAKVDVLARRIELTAACGELLNAVARDRSLHAYEADTAVRLGRQVVFMVEKPNPSADDFARAQAAVDAMVAIRAQRDEAPTAAALAELQTCAQRARLDPEWPPGDKALVACQPLQDLITGLRKSFLPDDAGKVPREGYVDAANAVYKAECVHDFAALLAASAAPEVLHSRLRFAHTLLQALQPGADESALRARQVLLQAEQSVDAAEVCQALLAHAGRNLRIEVDPPVPRQRQLVLLRLHLPQPGLNEAQARSQVQWQWQINGQDVNLGSDWTVWHFFEPIGVTRRWWHRWRKTGPTANVFQVCARTEVLPCGSAARPATRPLAIADSAGGQASGNQLVVAGPALVPLEMETNWPKSITLLSLASVGVTLLIVSVGLMTGAQEKLLTLDWLPGMVAIAAIGFGADVVKRALMRPD